MFETIVIGFSRVFFVKDKNTGEQRKKINISLSIKDPEYAEGVRAAELYLSADNVDYSWLKVGQKVNVFYSKFGFPVGLEAVK